jgi:hypothetical protein
MNEIFDKLTYAKEAVIWLVEHEGGLVDMHGLEYWAGVVERLRAEIKELL